jgi:EpsI family protein
MRANIAIRIFVAALIIGFTYLGMYLVEAGVQISGSELPTWKLQDLPMQLGDWKGEDKKLDERLFLATGAHTIVDRQYVNDAGRIISLHFAVFLDPNEGIWHNPFSCYESAGWNLVEYDKAQLPNTSDDKAKISLSIWEKNGEKAAIAYWYQLGDERLYTRLDLGTVRWKMRGKKIWPALIKVLLHTSGDTNPEENKDKLLEFADLIYQWINQPQHQAGNESPSPEATAPSEKGSEALDANNKSTAATTSSDKNSEAPAPSDKTDSQ